MERIFEAADQTSRLLFEDGLKNMDFSWIFSKGGTAAFVVTGVIALLMILFGAKCKYVLFAIQGFLLGVTAGLTASWFLHLEGWVMIGVSAGAGLVLAAFEAVFRKFGAFVFSLIAVFVSVAALGRRRLSGTWNRRRRGAHICDSRGCIRRSSDHSGDGNQRRRTWGNCRLPLSAI